jgi:hypothetical protein
MLAPVSFRVASDQATTPVAAMPATAAMTSPTDSVAGSTSGATAVFMTCRELPIHICRRYACDDQSNRRVNGTGLLLTVQPSYSVGVSNCCSREHHTMRNAVRITNSRLQCICTCVTAESAAAASGDATASSGVLAPLLPLPLLPWLPPPPLVPSPPPWSMVPDLRSQSTSVELAAARNGHICLLSRERCRPAGSS